MQKTTLPNRTHGFALKKFVIVVTMLLCGVVVLLPVFRRAKQDAQKSVCPNNSKRIALAFQQYQNDFDSHYPLVAVTDAMTHDGSPPYGWADSLQPYIRDTQVYQCTEDRSGGLGYRETTDAPNYTDYWYNANLVVRSKNKAGATIITGANNASLGSPSQTIVAGEGGNASGTPTGNARYNQCGDGRSLSGRDQTCATSPGGSSALATYPAAKLHLGGANFAFVDGHVKWLRGENDSQSAQIFSNAATQQTIGGKVTFSLLHK